MLVRRLTQHLRVQNWIAVALDLAVVVLGVFVALVVNSAVDHQRERLATYAALEGLRSDIAADLAQWEYHISRQDAQSESYTHLMDFLSGTGPITDPLLFVKDVQDISTYITMDPNDSELEELINTGNLHYISNRELRDALLDYRRQLRRITTFDPLHRSYFLEIYGQYAGQIAGGLSLPYRYRAIAGVMTEDAVRAEAARVLDAKAIRASDDLRRLLIAAHAPWAMQVLQYRSGQTKARKLLALLDAELGSRGPDPP